MSHDRSKPDPRRKMTWQEHEIWHAVDQLHQAYPEKERHFIQQVVEGSTKEVPRSEGLEKLLERTRKKLG
jgi:hypothetical protein